MFTLDPIHVIYEFDPDMESVLAVPSGAVVKFSANDCFFQQVLKETDVVEELDPDQMNPATGPVYVEGAARGDLLKVEILDIDLDDSGLAAVIPGEGVLADEAKESIVRIMPVEEGKVHYKGLQIPIRPMVGVIGVAPGVRDGAIRTNTPWKHGGNLDTKDIGIGSTLYFDVNRDGALFALGDCHAVMGDGEVGITGLEIPAEVTVRLSVIKGKEKIGWPFLETEDAVMVIGSGYTVEEACQAALSPLVKALASHHEISFEEAYILASLVVDMRISQLVNPKKTARAVISKSYLTAEDFLETLQA